MFGVVPKTLWQKRMPADDDNRVMLGLNTVVVRTGSAVVVIETGLGNKVSPKMRAIVENQERLPQSFKAAGISKVDVTHVVNTHLHWDHCGWNTILHEDGGVTPTFPHARYFVAAGELAHGRMQLERDRVSYLGPNYDPLIASGQLTVIDPDGAGGFTPDDARLCGPLELPPVSVQTETEIVPGVWVEQLPGHTETMLAVHIESEGATCLLRERPDADDKASRSDVVYGVRSRPAAGDRGTEEVFGAGRSRRIGWYCSQHDHAVPMARLMWDEKGKPKIRE